MYIHACIGKVSQKLAQRIAVLRKSRSFLLLKQGQLLYDAMVRSMMNYVNVVWTICNKENLDRNLKPQKMQRE